MDNIETLFWIQILNNIGEQVLKSKGFESKVSNTPISRLFCGYWVLYLLADNI